MNRILLVRRLAALWFVILGGLILTGCAKRSTNELVVGSELTYPPFEMTDTNNQPTGIGVDLAKALAAYLHKDLVVRNTQFTGLIPALKTGKLDLVISSMTVTEERARSIDFSDPYISTGICLLAAAPSDIQSIADVDKPGRKVVVRTGTTGAFYARDHFKSATVLPIKEEAACVLEVAQGKADCFIYDQLSIYQFSLQNPKTTRAILEAFQHESWAIGIRKGNDQLRQQVNAFIADFKARKGMEALGDKYIKADKAVFLKMGIPVTL